MRAIALVAALALAGCSQGGGRMGDGPRLRPAADPSKVIAAELAFNQLAQTKGQWTAFLDTAAEGAEMFVPQRVKAADWLKGRANPPVSVTWQPYEVWSSCDGSHAVTRGAWQRAGTMGFFMTVWQRQKNGGYKWVSDQSIATEAPPAPPEMIAARVAECPKGAKQAAEVAAALAGTTAGYSGTGDHKSGASDDSSLAWETTVEPDGLRHIAVRVWDGKQFDTVIDTSVPPHDH